MKTLLLFVGVIISLTSCVNTSKFNEVWVHKNQTFYERRQDEYSNPTTDTLFTKRLLKSTKVTLASVDDAFSPSSIDFTDVSDTIGKTKITDTLKNPGNKETDDFFPYDNDSVHKIKMRGNLYRSEYFKYIDIRPVFQAITIPFKYRFKLSETVPSTASADFNIGLAYGWQFKNNTYRRFYRKGKNNSYNTGSDFTTNWNFTPGIFLAPTVVDIDSALTQGTATTERSVIGLTYGAFIVGGYRSFNLGLALGIDNTFGSEPKAWVYSGKPWIGLMLGIDIFK